MRWIALCAVLFTAPVWAGDAAAARSLLQACSDQIDEDVVGLPALEKACPGLTAVLGDLGFDGRLHEGWEKSIDVYGIEALQALYDRYAGAPTAMRPSNDSLRTVLNSLGETDAPPPPSWWERAKAWLRELFGADSPNSSPWLRNLFDRLSASQAVLETILYVLIAIVVGLAIYIVLNELRAAGVLKRSGSQNGRASKQATHSAPRATLADVDAAGWMGRPSILLRLIIERLAALRRLESGQSLTHRELAARAQFPQSADRARFERLARLAETLRFGDSRARSNEFQSQAESIVGDARTLLVEMPVAERRP